MILVAGATGVLGSEICRLLVESGQPVRAFVRDSSDPKKVAQLRKLGADIAVGDLTERGSLDTVCGGVTTVISTVSGIHGRLDGDSIEQVDGEGQQNLIKAAKGAGVEQFVFISFPGAKENFPLQDAKRSVERALKESDMDYTILQPTCFMEVWLTPALGFDAAAGQARIYGSGENPISWISYQDVAKFAVAVVHNPAARNKVIKLGGPEALSPLEVVNIFEDLTGKKFSLEHVPEKALMQQKAVAADSRQQSFAGLMLYAAEGSAIPMDETLKSFPIRLHSVQEFAKQSVEHSGMQAKNAPV
jgi:uncharacterized protein YbjT (DUF2867 family)